MKKSILNYTSIFMLSIFLFSACKSQITEELIRQRLIYNNDGTDILWNNMFRRPLSVADVNAYVDSVANSQVSTFMMCSGSDYMYYRSEHGRVIGDNLDGALDCGCDTAASKDYDIFYKNHLNLEEEGTDIIDATLRRAKEKKLEAFISYRMNDLHFSDTALHCPVAYPDFFIEHPEYWLNEDIGWHSEGALDFAHKEVREHKLNIITEQLEKYGELLDGYDLDFMRFNVYFKSWEAEKKAPLMTKLLQDIRAKVDEVSEKYGKTILLSARVPVDIGSSLKMGMNVKEWIQQGLLDFVTISIFFNGNPQIPIAKFIADLGGAVNRPVYGAMENGGYYPRELFSHGVYRGMASNILAQGGDGIYMFNYFFGDYVSKYNSETHLEEGSQVCRVTMPGLLQELGSLETLRKRNKIYCLDDGSSGTFGDKSITPLPLSIQEGDSATATIFIGDNIQKDTPEEALLFLRTDKPAKFECSVNGNIVENQRSEYVSLYNRGNNLRKTETVYAFIIPASCLRQGDNKVSFNSDNDELFKVKRLEVALKYGDVKTHGYF